MKLRQEGPRAARTHSVKFSIRDARWISTGSARTAIAALQLHALATLNPYRRSCLESSDSDVQCAKSVGPSGLGLHQFGTRFSSRFGQVVVRLRTALDGARFHTVGTPS